MRCKTLPSTSLLADASIRAIPMSAVESATACGVLVTFTPKLEIIFKFKWSTPTPEFPMTFKLGRLSRSSRSIVGLDSDTKMDWIFFPISFLFSRSSFMVITQKCFFRSATRLSCTPWVPPTSIIKRPGNSCSAMTCSGGVEEARCCLGERHSSSDGVATI